MKSIKILAIAGLLAIAIPALAAHDNGNGNSQHPGCSNEDYDDGECVIIVLPPVPIPPGPAIPIDGDSYGDTTSDSFSDSFSASEASSEASANSSSDSSSNAVSNSSSVSGDSSATGGNSSANAGSGNGNTVIVQGDSTKEAANSAAQSIGSICVDSAAGQGTSFGLSISRANPVCEQLQMYKIHTAIGDTEKAAEALANAEQLTDIRGFFRGFLTIITLGLL